MVLAAPVRVPIVAKVAPSKSIDPFAANKKFPLGATTTVLKLTLPRKYTFVPAERVQLDKFQEVASRYASTLEDIFALETKSLHNNPPLIIRLSKVIVWVGPVIVTLPRLRFLLTKTTMSLDKSKCTPPEAKTVAVG